MIRNLKALGLALVAVFAFSALSASAASAQSEQGTLTADGPVTLTGEETGTLFQNAFTNSLGKVTCDGSTYTGHKVLTHSETTAGKEHELLPSGSTSATITPHYSTHCTAHIAVLGTRPATVTMNGCDYVFDIGSTTPAGNTLGTYGVSADLVCPPEKDVEVEIYKTGQPHTDPNKLCHITITSAENQDLDGPHLTHTNSGGADDFDLFGTFDEVHEEHTGTLCGEGTSDKAELHVDVTIDGHDKDGKDTNVTITDTSV